MQNLWMRAKRKIWLWLYFGCIGILLVLFALFPSESPEDKTFRAEFHLLPNDQTVPLSKFDVFMNYETVCILGPYADVRGVSSGVDFSKYAGDFNLGGYNFDAAPTGIYFVKNKRAERAIKTWELSVRVPWGCRKTESLCLKNMTKSEPGKPSTTLIDCPS